MTLIPPSPYLACEQVQSTNCAFGILASSEGPDLALHVMQLIQAHVRNGRDMSNLLCPNGRVEGLCPL